MLITANYFTDTKLEEYPTNEKEVMKILTEVAVARREAEIVSHGHRARQPLKQGPTERHLGEVLHFSLLQYFSLLYAEGELTLLCNKRQSEIGDINFS